MLMYNQLEHSQNYSVTAASLWNYYRDKIDEVYDNVSGGKSFEYKTKTVGKTAQRPKRPERPGPDQDGNTGPRPNQSPIPPLNMEFVVP